MEIHRRARPSNTNADTSHNNVITPLPSRGRAKTYGPPIKAKTINPYSVSASSSTADVIILRTIQVLLLLAAAWFLYALAVVNAPELDTTPITITTDGIDVDGSSSVVISRNSEAASESSGLRGGPALSLLKLPKNIPAVDPNEISSARDKISQLRDEFYTRYGGKKIAMDMLKKGLRTFENKSGNAKNDGGSVRSTANRFLSSIVRHEASSTSTSSQQHTEQAEFVMAFAGYSVTVGRGNHLEQSYPFVLEKVLSPILKLPPLNIKLTVRNSAIGGIPSFPYGWCLSNFLGEDADLVSWDYGMNEGNGASGLESYVRQSLMMPKSPPLFVLLDMKRPRLDLLQTYVDLGALPDPVALGGRDAVDKTLLQLADAERPVGLQKWDEWGAPKGAPGQSPWHPKKMEHELMGWMMAMHILDALDVALDVMEQDKNWRDPILTQEQHAGTTEVVLPPPVTGVSKTGAASLLHGTKSEADQWHMNHVSCRTSFLPNISGDMNSVVQSGVTKVEEDMLKTRDDALFNDGWVMDVGKLERDTKVKVLKYGGLGYIDMKTALYGIPSSGTLKLWLPYEGGHGRTKPNDGDVASKYYNAVVLCEVNEKRGDKECKMTSDLSIRVGDASMPKSNVSQVKGVASYLKKDICIRLEIPKEAKISSNNGESGVAVDVTVTGSGVTRENGACSISHVIWENQ